MSLFVWDMYLSSLTSTQYEFVVFQNLIFLVSPGTDYSGEIEMFCFLSFQLFKYDVN